MSFRALTVYNTVYYVSLLHSRDFGLGKDENFETDSPQIHYYFSSLARMHHLGSSLKWTVRRNGSGWSYAELDSQSGLSRNRPKIGQNGRSFWMKVDGPPVHCMSVHIARAILIRQIIETFEFSLEIFIRLTYVTFGNIPLVAEFQPWNPS